MKKFFCFFLLIQIRLFQNPSSTIENCSELGTGENSDKCIKCQDKYFLFFNNLYCVPCDDKSYGQIGCGGNCDSSKYRNDRFVYCNKNQCKEGYYDLMGICFSCSVESPGCKTCHATEIQTDDGQIDYDFKCEECFNEYKLDKYGKCEKCEMDHCLECKFTNDNSNKECLQCEYDYYISQDKTCKSCYYYDINGGHCTICSDDNTNLDLLTCYCYSNYVLNENNTCTKCTDGCTNCILKEGKTPYCLECDSGEFVEENKCLICNIEGCNTCILDENKQTICKSCYSNYAYLNGKCKFCSSGCDQCVIKENNKLSCASCYSDYALTPNETCTYCKSIDYIGGNHCERCRFNEIENKYECLQCNTGYNTDLHWYTPYAYIKNKYQCLNNKYSDDYYLYGCLEANFIEENKYECLKCEDNFIPIINDKTCRKPREINLNDDCLEGINIGNELNAIYSCNKCNNKTVLITNLDNINDCYERSNNLVYCLKGNIDNENNLICNECVTSAHLNENNSIPICECDSDSFGVKDSFCYKCDDEFNGNPGCKASDGCLYKSSNDQLNCNTCKSNYFEYTKGQCFSCSNELQFCNKCKVDNNDQFICEDCIDNFIYNKFEKVCELNCEEYPDISPGCIICNEEYKLKGKCQACKLGYFKTKDESCVNCKSEKYGGSECNKCGYAKNGEDIICEKCIEKYHIINSKGKCINCKEKLFKECERCEFIINDNNEEKLVCILCQKGYFLDSNNNCVNYLQFFKIINNCDTHKYLIGDFTIKYDNYQNIYFNFYYNNSYYSYHYYYDYDYYDYYKDEKIAKFLNDNLKQINPSLKVYCEYCKGGFYLNSNTNECLPIKIENCTINSMIKNNFYYNCRDFCKYNQYPLILLNVDNSLNQNSFITISEIYNKYRYSISFNEFKYLINQTLCIDNTNKSEHSYLQNCVIAIYLEKENKYICNVCNEGYFLYKETNKCIKFDEEMNCEYENIGTETNPIFSCIRCRYYYYDIYDKYFSYYQFNQTSYYENDDFYYYSDYILVKEGNINFCVKKDYNLDYCLTANVSTKYITNKYDCTTCLINHLPYYSKYYERQICQSIFEEIKISDNIEEYQYYSNKIEAIEGECQNDTLFTPDGTYCYKCTDYMYGCKSKCNFSKERKNNIKCLDGCKDGYIESSEGICESCNNINYGCNKCHYENEYPNNYFGIKRKRRFICDSCYKNDDYYIKKDDKCFSCYSFDEGCNKCQINNNEFKCIECSYRYILDDKGHCNYCSWNNFIYDNKCIQCNNTSKYGIEGCNSCDFYNNKTYCSICDEGYVLLKNNRTCLKISENEELRKHTECRELTIENNKFYCLECKDYKFSILKENDEAVCIYLPELNGYIEDDDYYYDDINIYEKNNDIDNIYKYYFRRYLRYYFSHCVEVINLGSKENPLYSCTKCYDSYYLLTDENSNISYCIYNYQIKNNIENCTEKKIKIRDKEIKFTCINCEENNILVYHEIDKVNYCKYSANVNNDTNLCMVQNCRECKPEDNYFCEICELEDEIVSNITGACIKRIESVPDITWKDVFRLEMNSQKEINGKVISGPKLHLKGETNSQINQGHAFIIYLIFKIKQPLNIRNLDDANKQEIRIRAICEVVDAVEENNEDSNTVEYECIGDSEGVNLENSELSNIEGGSGSGNIQQLVATKDLTKIENGPTVEFMLDIIKNQTSNNYIFDFKIDGKVDDNKLKDVEIKEELKMNEIDEASNCIFTIEKNKKSNLNCKLNVENHKDIKVLTFKTTRIEYKNEYNISLVDLNKIYLINEEEEKSSKKMIYIIIGCIGGIVTLSLIVIITICICKKKKNNMGNIDNMNNGGQEPNKNNNIKNIKNEINVIHFQSSARGNIQ